ncbi:MAG: hypothetical protein JRJ87_21060 [Deltaproteobacteria bacterium]|nr:hypothetical protein [Deltaproteobacteria bacterium]
MVDRKQKQVDVGSLLDTSSGKLETNKLLETVSNLEARLMQQRQDIKKIARWLEQIDRYVLTHFNSWSWRVGFNIVKLVKKVLLSDHPPVSSYRLNEVLRTFRLWKNEHSDLETAVLSRPARYQADLTILAGDISKGLKPGLAELLEKTGPKNSVQVLGFDFDIQQDRSEPSKVVKLAGCDFPDFFEVLVKMLVQTDTQGLVVMDDGLLGLGLGLLHNYHYGTPLFFVGDKSPGQPKAGPAQVDWQAPEYLKPSGRAWRDLVLSSAVNLPALDLSKIVSRLNDQLAQPAEPSVLDQAREFAGLFGKFHANCRGLL